MSFIDYDTKTFSDVWPDADAFAADYAIWIPRLAGTFAPLTAPRQSQLFYLLFARYGNSPLANWDESQFKAKLFSIVFQYGPTWEKRLDIQERLKALDLDDETAALFKGTKSIFNHAAHPAAEPTDNTLDELEYIDEQNVNGYKYNKLDAYRRLWDLLRVDVSEEFLRQFSKCFSKFAGNRHPIVYITEGE